jgi:hypothetical protein
MRSEPFTRALQLVSEPYSLKTFGFSKDSLRKMIALELRVVSRYDLILRLVA